MFVSFDRSSPIAAPLRFMRTSPQDANALVARDGMQALGAVALGCPAVQAIAAPSTTLALPDALGGAGSIDWWLGAAPVQTGTHAGVRWAADGECLFAAIEVDATHGFAQAVESAYGALFATLGANGYRYVWRVWNFIPHIHDERDGLERYRLFNQARHRAFVTHGHPAFEGAPAASALGTRDGPIAIHLLAARRAAVAIENPRQVSAYRYPGAYGPRAPNFSRAALAQFERHETLLVSGTASIVGHASAHAGDARAQTRETLANLEAIAQQANRRARSRQFRVEDFALRVYVRNREDVDGVRDTIARELGGQAHAHFVLADICRRELLVEIEAVG